MVASLKQGKDYEAVGGHAYIADAVQACPVTQHWRHYVRLIRVAYARRRALETGVHMIRYVLDGDKKLGHLCTNVTDTMKTMIRWLKDTK